MGFGSSVIQWCSVNWKEVHISEGGGAFSPTTGNYRGVQREGGTRGNLEVGSTSQELT